MPYVIITLILIFGCTLTGIGLRLVAGQRRMEQRQAVALAALRTAFGMPPDEPQPEPGQRTRPVLVVYKGGAGLLLAAFAWSRRHWIAATGSALTAAAAALALTLGHTPTIAAGPPQAGRSATAALTGAVIPAAPTTVPPLPGSAPRTAVQPSAPPPSTAVTLVLAGGAPAAPDPIAAPSTSTPAPVRSPSAPPSSTPAQPPTIPVPPPSTPSSSAPCLLAVNATPILALCLL